MQLRHVLFALLLVAFATSGCIFQPEDDGPGDTPPPASFEPASSPDEVMLKFREIYEDRNLEFYAQLLSEDYLFIPRDDDRYGYDVEMTILDKMFNEAPASNGYVISDVSVVQLDPQGVWQDTPANDPDFAGTGSQYRTYQVQIDFSIAGQSLILRVQGAVIYYVRPEQVDGEQVYKLLGMVDLTVGG